MQALAELRDQINELDYQLIHILGERMEVADKIVSLPRNARDLPAERVEVTIVVVE